MERPWDIMEKDRDGLFLCDTRKMSFNRQRLPRIIKEIERLKVECERLRELSHLDSLTGLSIGLIMIDIDYFKRLNHKFGHEAGNRALQWFSGILRKQLRRIDIPCRYGGEEFSIILPGVRFSQAIHEAERLRVCLDSTPIPIDEQMVHIRASFGVDTYAGNENSSVEKFINRTDHFLLQAKAKGRNRVCYDKHKARIVPTEVSHEERALLFTHGP